MYDLNEAQSLNLGYEDINQLSEDLNDINNIRDCFILDNFIKSIGGVINFLPILKWEKFEVPFIKINGVNNFTINLFNEVTDEMKRVILVQAIGHYILHSQNGTNPCKIEKLSFGDAAREGFIFSLSLLMPDQMIVKMIESNKFSSEEIARMFRVPEQILTVKYSVLKKYNKI